MSSNLYNNNKKLLTNAYLMALFIFQFGIMQPFATLANSQYPVILSTFFLIIVGIKNNGFYIRKRTIFTIILVLSLFLISILIYKVPMVYTLPVIIGFFYKSAISLYFSDLKTEEKYLEKAFINVALINFLIVAFAPYISSYDSMNYMRYGYALLPSSFIFIYALLATKLNKYKFTVLAAVSTIFIVIYGARGSSLCLIILATILFAFTNKINFKQKMTILTVVILFFVIIVSSGILVELLNLISELGVNSYSLIKLKIMLLNGISASTSSRDTIYALAIKKIMKKPLFGSGLGSSMILVGVYPHNIILQIALEFGLIGLIIFISSIVLLIKINFNDIRRFNNFSGFIIIMFFSISFGRLLVSSNFWIRTEFWFLIGLLLKKVNIIQHFSVEKI